MPSLAVLAGDVIEITGLGNDVVRITDTQANTWVRLGNGTWQCVNARPLTAADAITFWKHIPSPQPGRPAPVDLVEAYEQVRDTPRSVTARWGGTCRGCARPIEPGETIIWSEGEGAWVCDECGSAE